MLSQNSPGKLMKVAMDVTAGVDRPRFELGTSWIQVQRVNALDLLCLQCQRSEFNRTSVHTRFVLARRMRIKMDLRELY